jgi:hypothetical protein
VLVDRNILPFGPALQPNPTISGFCKPDELWIHCKTCWIRLSISSSVIVRRLEQRDLSWAQGLSRRTIVRLEWQPPVMEPNKWREPSRCPFGKYGGRHFRVHRMVTKGVRHTVNELLTARRYGCQRYRRMIRVYPTGGSHAPTSRHVKGLAVMWYLLGSSMGRWRWPGSIGRSRTQGAVMCGCCFV